MLKVKFSPNRERSTTLKFLLFYDDFEETKGLIVLLQTKACKWFTSFRHQISYEL